MKRIFKNALPLIFVLGTILLQSQDFTITDANGSMQMISDGWMKDTGEDQDFIFNIDKDILIVVDYQMEKYAKGSIEDYCNAMKILMQNMKEGIPAEQWEIMVNMQKQMPDPEVQINSRGSGEKIAGYFTEKFEVIVNGELYEEIWITYDASLQELIDFSKEAGKLGEEIMLCASMGEDFTAKDPQSTQAYKDMEAEGIVLKKVNHEYGMTETDTEVINIDDSNIDASEFEAPSEFEQLTFSELMNYQMNREDE